MSWRPGCTRVRVSVAGSDAPRRCPPLTPTKQFPAANIFAVALANVTLDLPRTQAGRWFPTLHPSQQDLSACLSGLPASMVASLHVSPCVASRAAVALGALAHLTKLTSLELPYSEGHKGDVATSKSRMIRLKILSSCMTRGATRVLGCTRDHHGISTQAEGDSLTCSAPLLPDRISSAGRRWRLDHAVIIQHVKSSVHFTFYEC